ncbi:MAG: hypothetical protein A2V70_15640 [Planctomycetes bacterium RBG_13_63_9]|nr:MAG: hypothetical protein A2V70_15640 [Planctomycetes bacterium RBG_13_63_9]
MTDTAGNQNQHQFEITVAPAPQLDPIGAKAVAEGELLKFTATGTGQNAPLSFSLDPGAPSGATIEGDTGVFRWTPDEAQGPGQYQIKVRLTDGVTGATIGETITVTVTEVNSVPEINPIPDQTAREDDLLQFAVAVTDADLPANALTFSLGAGAPQGAAIHPTTGAFTWRPGQQHGGGSFPITVRVADAAGATDEQSFTVFVEEVVDPRPAELDAVLAAWEAGPPENPTPPTLPDVFLKANGSLGLPVASSPLSSISARTGQSSIFPDSGLFGTRIGPDTGLGGGAGDESEQPDGESSSDSTREQPANTEASPEEPNNPDEDDQSARRVPIANDLAMELFADDELFDDELFDADLLAADELSTADGKLAMALAQSPLQ